LKKQEHLNKKAYIFSPHNLFPTQSGFQKRALSLVDGFIKLNCEVTLLSSSLSSKPSWNSASVQHLKSNQVKEISIYKPDIWDYRYINLVKSIGRKIKLPATISSSTRTPPGMRRWFTDIITRKSPSLILMNYSMWDGLVNHRKFKSIRRVVDALDLYSLNRKMRQALTPYLPPSPIHPDDVDDQILQENFFELLKMSPDKSEYAIFDKYSDTIAISLPEANDIRKNTSNTRVTYLPMASECAQIDNQYSGPAFFPTGPNPFNTQGYLYFAKKVLPIVRKAATDFKLVVTGYCSAERVIPVDGTVLEGFIPDLRPIYEHACFVICPVIGGTGQQVKIVEAMAHGVPVIALKSAAARTPLEHNVNGLIANNAEEFAGLVLELWLDRGKCRELGQAARQTIETQFSQQMLIEKLSLFV